MAGQHASARDFTADRQPRTARGYLRVAEERLQAVSLLHDQFLSSRKLRREVWYRAGYVSECSIKAMILLGVGSAGHDGMYDRIRRGSTAHQFWWLLERLTDPAVAIPTELRDRLVSDQWKPELRYSVGRCRREEVERTYLNAQGSYDWTYDVLCSAPSR